jgi:ketosteroid isomerase-like protein
MTRIFPSAQDAESAFYEALEHADLEAMMAVWAEDEDIICVHPGGPRLAGLEQVREGWRRIFAGGPGPRAEPSLLLAIPGVMTAVHSVQENFLLADPQGKPAPAAVIATNVYARTPAGWRMIVHHASPLPAQQPAQEAVADPRPSAKKTLH